MGNLRQKYNDAEWDKLTENAFKSSREPLILSPNQSINNNVKLFNKWLKETYEKR